jgi:hypothetical protein
LRVALVEGVEDSSVPDVHRIKPGQIEDDDEEYRPR